MTAPGTRERIAPVVLLAAMASLLVLGSLHKRLAYDEFDNLAYGHRFLTEGPSAEMRGQRMPVLALNALGCVAEGCRRKVLDESETRRLLVRLPTMAFTLLQGLLVFRVARSLFGPRAALLALLLHCFQPTFLGHGKQVTSDVQTAFFTLGAVECFRRAIASASARWAILAGLAMAGALASKFTSVLLGPIFLILAACVPADLPPRRRVAFVAIALAAALFGINAAYLFDGTFQAAGAYAWQSEGFRRALPGVVPAWMPIPLPRTFVLGLDYSRFLQENPLIGRGANYVLGELNRDGRWYAFPLMLLLKTPLATFALVALAFAGSRIPRATLLALLVPPVVIVLFFSLAVDPQLGIRYILPALPFLVVLAAAAAREGARWTRPAWALAAWAVVSSLSYHPHPIAYFNELIGRRVNAYRYLADSNLDWEDHEWYVERFKQRRPELNVVVDPPHPQVGHVLVSVNRYVGVMEPERFRWLRERFRPIGHVAYSHLLFRITPEELAALPPSYFEP